MKRVSVNVKTPNFSWQGQMIECEAYKDECKTMIFTVFDIKSDSIRDYVLENFSFEKIINENIDQINVTSDAITETPSVFTIVELIHPDEKTLMNMAKNYDGRLIYHNGNPTLFIEKDNFNELIGEASAAIFVTAY